MVLYHFCTESTFYSRLTLIYFSNSKYFISTGLFILDYYGISYVLNSIVLPEYLKYCIRT